MALLDDSQASEQDPAAAVRGHCAQQHCSPQATASGRLPAPASSFLSVAGQDLF